MWTSEDAHKLYQMTQKISRKVVGSNHGTERIFFLESLTKMVHILLTIAAYFSMWQIEHCSVSYQIIMSGRLHTSGQGTYKWLKKLRLVFFKYSYTFPHLVRHLGLKVLSSDFSTFK